MKMLTLTLHVVVEAERVQSGEEESSDTEEWSRRSKMPRMRMHADDEEKKIEKRLKRRHQDRYHRWVGSLNPGKC